MHKVTEIDGYRVLVHGNTIHGMQHLDPRLRDEPLTYYHKDGPIGQYFQALAKKHDDRLTSVGLIGLGTGALACYSETGQHWTFFEIDPAVIRIAQDRKLFTYLNDHKDQVDVILGDGRLTLEPMETRFGVLVVDAFGSDSIPLHLLTREAFAIYRQRLRPGGVIAFHISNRYFHLEPVLANLAQEAGWACRIRNDLKGDDKTKRFPSIWLIMAESPAHLTDFIAMDARPDPSLQPWTDDFSNVLQILKWGKE